MLAAVLGIVLFAAFSPFGNESGPTSAAPSIDRVATTHVSFGAADLAPASSAAVPIRYLPGDINATSLAANDADMSNPLNAFPVSLTRAVDSLTAASLPFYGSLSPGASVSSLPMASDANGPNVKGINNDTMFLNALARYMTINTINVSREPVTNNLVGKTTLVSSDGTMAPTQVIDSPASNTYSLTSRWSLITWAGADASASYVKGTNISGTIPDATNNAIVTAIYGRDDTSKLYIQTLPSGTNVLDATTKVTLSSGQAYWIAVTSDPAAKGIHFGNLSWADTVNHYTAAIENARGDNVQFMDPFIPAVAAGGGLVLDNGTLNTNAYGNATCGVNCGSAPWQTALLTRTGAGINSIIKEWNVLEDANFTGSLSVTANGDYTGFGHYSAVHAMDPGIGTRDIGTTVGAGPISGTVDYPVASTSVSGNSATWIKVASNADGNSAITSTNTARWQAFADTALADPGFLGIVAGIAILAAFALAVWTIGPGTPNQHRAVRAPGAG